MPFIYDIEQSFEICFPKIVHKTIMSYTLNLLPKIKKKTRTINVLILRYKYFIYIMTIILLELNNIKI